MPKTINSGFDELQSRLNITTLQAGTVSARHTNLRDVIKAEFTTIDDFLTGSYRRSTMVLPLKDADVDVMIVLDPSYYNKYTATALLDRVRTVLLKKYTTPKISRSGQAVTIAFSDFKVDVVVGYNRSGGGYLIANSNTGSYLSTNPKTHVEQWSASNSAQNGMLVPLMKMVKGWNRENGDLLRSFHLEAMVRSVYEGGTVGNYPGAVTKFFEVAKNSLDVPDPAGYGGNVGSYLSAAAREGVVSRFSSAHIRATDAIDYAVKGAIEKAYERWALVFGKYWPAYG
jgi:hypothetical protein